MQQRPNFIVKRSVALKSPIRHQLVPGLGYVAHEDEPELGPQYHGKKNCKPADGTPDKTMHLLRPPGGHPPMGMVWVQKDGAWASQMPGKGNRLAWSTAYLSKVGWEYVGPARG